VLADRRLDTRIPDSTKAGVKTKVVKSEFIKGAPIDVRKQDAFHAWLEAYRESLAETRRKSHNMKETRLPGQNGEVRETG
jgi:hypothetical protein